MTNDAKFIEDQCARLARFMNESALVRESIPGIHIEGPFISEKSGYRGAHAEEYTRAPDWTLFEKWQRASGGKIRIVTLSPELPGSVDFIRQAAASGLLVSLGHTDASLEQLWAAVEAGARMFTHLGNGCAVEMHRHDNIIQRVLGIPELLASVIPDGIHIPPVALGNIMAGVGPARLVLTTDAVSAAGAPAGNYRIGELEVCVGEDRVVMHCDGEVFAGSSLRPVDAFYHAVRFGGLGVEATWRALTRMRGILYPGLTAPRLALPFPLVPKITKE